MAAPVKHAQNLTPHASFAMQHTNLAWAIFLRGKKRKLLTPHRRRLAMARETRTTSQILNTYAYEHMYYQWTPLFRQGRNPSSHLLTQWSSFTSEFTRPEHTCCNAVVRSNQSMLYARLSTSRFTLSLPFLILNCMISDRQCLRYTS